MGGWGSGGHNKTHDTVERYRRIDSFELGRYLKEADDEGDMLYVYDPVFYGSNRFRLHWVEGVDGSCSRLYFGCPECRRRVRYLYARGAGYVCRCCLGANYQSQQLRPWTIEDVRRRMRKIVEDQLGYTRWEHDNPKCQINELGYTRWEHDNPKCQINELEIIPKPRYMRWAKYSALMMEFRELQNEYWRAFLRDTPLQYRRKCWPL